MSGASAWHSRPDAASLMQSEITYADGTVKRVATDRSWKASLGPLVQADLIMGERTMPVAS